MSGTSHLRYSAGRRFRRMKLRVYAWRLLADPETAEWVHSAKALAADREAVAKLLAEQPDPRELIEHYRSTSGGGD